MTEIRTRLQRKNLSAAKKAKIKYHNDKSLHKQGLHNRWQYMFIGNMPIDKLNECFGIVTETVTS